MSLQALPMILFWKRSCSVAVLVCIVWDKSLFLPLSLSLLRFLLMLLQLLVEAPVFGTLWTHLDDVTISGSVLVSVVDPLIVVVPSWLLFQHLLPIL